MAARWTDVGLCPRSQGRTRPFGTVCGTAPGVPGSGRRPAALMAPPAGLLVDQRVALLGPSPPWAAGLVDAVAHLYGNVFDGEDPLLARAVGGQPGSGRRKLEPAVRAGLFTRAWAAAPAWDRDRLEAVDGPTPGGEGTGEPEGGGGGGRRPRVPSHANCVWSRFQVTGTT